MFDQVLVILKELGGFPHELHEVNHQFALPPLPVYRSLRFTWHAAVWWKVRTLIWYESADFAWSFSQTNIKIYCTQM